MRVFERVRGVFRREFINLLSVGGEMKGLNWFRLNKVEYFYKGEMGIEDIL